MAQEKKGPGLKPLLRFSTSFVGLKPYANPEPYADAKVLRQSWDLLIMDPTLILESCADPGNKDGSF
ncbi:hypothetical protein GCM10011585_02250 [Edaphobacter dinghuensis]|uniref:Uncharacterized protein n=1 Tax=Edaphobacter dinghuensis TaxID=1560005 RepID=A0A917LXT8_9BACT|nr:hypothetical protein GCM10011585_02250 [Edaphobacter dinghuensis]